MVLDSAEDRLRDRADIELVVAAKPGVVPHNSPSNARGYEFSTNIVIGRRVNRAKQISGLDCQFESLRVQFFRRCLGAGLFSAGENLRARENDHTGSESAKRFHSARLRYGRLIGLQLIGQRSALYPYVINSARS